MSKKKRAERTQRDSFEITPAGTRLYRTLTNPENFNLNVTQMCERANVARSTYYRLTKNKTFMDKVKEEQRRIVDANSLQVLFSAFHYANNSPKNHADRKLILEWAGEYREEVTTNIKGEIDVKNTTDQLMEYLTSDLKGS